MRAPGRVRRSCESVRQSPLAMPDRVSWVTAREVTPISTSTGALAHEQKSPGVTRLGLTTLMTEPYRGIAGGPSCRRCTRVTGKEQAKEQEPSSEKHGMHRPDGRGSEMDGSRRWRWEGAAVEC